MRRVALAVALACASLASGSLHAQAASGAGGASGATSEIAPAERLLFMQSHMSGVDSQTELDYAMNLSGPPEKVSDTVRVLVLSQGNAKNDARVTDHTGKVEVPGGLPCNPVILYFLEHDIAEMEQLTGGQRRYFQHRVRLALAAGPPVTAVASDANGKRVKAQKVVIQPYLNDPNASRFAQYTGKRYTFVFADEVPGKVVMIRTEVPGANNDFEHPMVMETISYQGTLRNLGPSGPGSAPPVKSSNAPRASR
jgi:hypothetical protein